MAFANDASELLGQANSFTLQLGQTMLGLPFGFRAGFGSAKSDMLRFLFVRIACEISVQILQREFMLSQHCIAHMLLSATLASPFPIGSFTG